MPRLLFAGLLLLTLTACESDTSQTPPPPPVAFHEHDECHVCGMLITRYPGPKAQLYSHQQEQALKFCSTRDLFAYVLEPGNAAHIQAIYVHDMAQGSWQQPDDAHLIRAEQAWYVVGHPLRGAMGPSPASFAKREDAVAFAQQQGGKVVKYEDISLESLN